MPGRSLVPPQNRPPKAALDCQDPHGQHWDEISVLVRPGVIVAEAMTGALGRLPLALSRVCGVANAT